MNQENYLILLTQAPESMGLLFYVMLFIFAIGNRIKENI